MKFRYEGQNYGDMGQSCYCNVIHR